MNVSVEAIGPNDAETLLSNMQINRGVSKSQVKRFQEIMESGKWRHDIGETIKITKSGKLVDGQHRLRAIIASGRVYQVAVTRGVADDAMDIIDTGRSRTASDLLVMRGHKNAGIAASAAKKMMIYETWGMQGFFNSTHNRIENNDVLRYAERHMDLLQESVHYGKGDSLRAMMPPSNGAFVYSVLSRAGREGERFLSVLSSGSVDQEDRVIVNLRNALANRRLKGIRGDAMGPVFSAKAWNAWIKGDLLKLFKEPKTPNHYPRFDLLG